MTWTIDAPWETPSKQIGVAPDNILYAFDGPQLFTAKFGFFESIFVRFDDHEDSSLWLVSALRSDVLKLIEENRISVRAAFIQDRCWIVQTGAKFIIERYWSCDFSELSEDMLPAPGVSLAPSGERVPDTIEQSTAYFSIGFKGQSLTGNTMPFSVLKHLVDSAYDVSRKILGPPVLKGSKSTTFDLQVEPRISSLILSIDHPIYNEDQVNRRLLESEMSFDDMVDQVTKQRTDFFAGMNSAVKAVKFGEANADFDESSRRAAEQVHYLIPEVGYKFNSIEFSANFDGKVSTIYIDQQVGGRIRRALARSVYEKAERTGVVVEINAEASTFLLKSRTGRLTTCVIPRAFFDQMQKDDEFVIGASVTAKGNFERRQRRDRIFATVMPVIH